MKLFSQNFNRDVVWSLLGGGIPALAGLLAIPLLVRLLSVDQFALVSLLLSLNLFFFVYDVGLTRTMHFFAPQKEYLSLNGAASLLTSCLFTGFLIGLVVSVAIYWASPSLVLSWLDVKSDLISESILAFQITAFGIIPALLIHVLKGSMEGRQRFRAANVGKIISGVSLFLFPVLTTFYSKSLVMIAEAILVSRLLSFLVYFGLALHAVSFKVIRLNFDITKKLIKYTFWAAISGFFSTLFVYGDRFIVAGYIDASSLAIYITSQDVLIRYLIVPWSISVVLVPYFSRHNDEKILDDLYSKSLKSISILTLLFTLVVALLLLVAIPIWLKQDLINLAQTLSAILMVGVVFAAFAQLPLIALYAKGKAKLLSMIFLGEGVFYLISAPVIFKYFGVIGAACVWSSRLFIEFILLRYFSNKLLKDKLS